MCAFDTETTGVDVETARIVTAAVVTVRPHQPTKTIPWLIDPGVEIPEGATRVHGITTEHARAEGLPSAGAVAAICEALMEAVAEGLPLVVFNAPYDLTLLEFECRRHDLPTLHEQAAEAGVEVFVVDPLVLDKAMVPRRKGKGARQLESLSVAYGVPLSKEDAHTAAGDCLAAARVAYMLAKRFPTVAGMNLPALQVYQAEKHFEWAEQFEGWLRSQGKDEVIDRSWPVSQVATEVQA